MKYREIRFTENGYTEKAYDSIPENTDGCLALTDEYRDYEIGDKGIIRIGDHSNDDIIIEGSPDIRIVSGAVTSREPVYINGSLGTESKLKKGDRIFIKNTEIVYYPDRLRVCGKDTVVNLNPARKEKGRFEDFPVYKRSPRIVKREPTTKIDIKPPREKQQPKRGELIKRIIPSLVMVCACIAMGLFMGRGIFMLVMVAATGATLVITVVSYFDERKQRKQEEKDRTENYKQYLLGKRKELYRAEKSFLESREYHNLNLSEIAEETRKYSNRIYERNYNDADFLTVSLGRGSQIPSYRIDCSRDEFSISKDPLYQEMMAVYNNFRVVDNVPCVIDLKKAHLGIVGNREYIRSRLYDIVTQLSFFQSYHDIQFIAFVDEEDKAQFGWMKWLPHMTVGSINVTGLISGENQRDQVLGHINQILKGREISRDEEKKERRFSPHYVFIVDSPKLLINHSIMEHLKEAGSDLGYSLIFTTQIQSNLPENIKTILTVDAKSEGTLLMNEGALDGRKLRFDEGDISFEDYARRLKPLIHNKGITTQIPESVSFFDIYDVDKPESIPISELWKKNASHKSLSVPLGVRGKNDIVNLDLHEKAHGPHGLVAGTTGSGKSEILQSYILSLAVNFHPHEVGFLLIDYKGGGMANLFQDLPHLLGTITNLDGSESMRALASIKSELRRRQDIFNQSGVNNINKYTEKFKAKEVTEPLPHLFIISDEFAELKKEQPEFMAELVSTARVGRSLGVHLILATQKPTGIVDDQIWSNSRFKLCLKVQNEADSRELLKTGDAASITQPGRAYLQVGNNEIYELFQSAYSGATYSEETASEAVDKRIYVINELGQGILINEDLSDVDDSDHGNISQLDAVIEEIRRVYESEPHFEVAKPWLPPLPDMMTNPGIDMDAVVDVGTIERADLTAPVGVIDMPDKQKQQVFLHSFNSDGNLGIFGAASTGKSTVLMNVALSLAVKNSPSMLNYYVIDLGNSALISLARLPHTADYINFDDEEKQRKIKNIIDGEIHGRKKLFGKANVTNLEMFNKTSDNPLPAVIILVDNYDVVREMGPEEEDFYTRLARDGVSVGVYLCVTATRSNAMKYAIFNSLNVRISNYMTDPSEIYTIVGRSKYTLGDIKGRGLIKIDEPLIMQEYLPVDAREEFEYIDKINDLIARISDSNSGQTPKPIPVLPEKLEMYDLMARRNADTGLALGLDSEEVEVKYINDSNLQLIIGPAGSGRSNVLKVLLQQMEQSPDAELIIVDSESQEFMQCANDPDKRYISKEEEIDIFCSQLEEIILEREMLYENSGGQEKQKVFYAKLPPVYILVDDVSYFCRIMSARMDADKLLTKAMNTDVRIFAAVNSKQFSGIDPVTKLFKNAQNGIILGKPTEQAILQVGLYRDNPQEDEGVVFENGLLTKIKIPFIDG